MIAAVNSLIRLSLVLLCVIVTTTTGLAAPNSTQRAEIDRLTESIDVAISNIKDGDFDAALDHFQGAQAGYDQLSRQLVASDAETQQAIRPLVRGLAVVRSRLEFEGLAVPPPGAGAEGSEGSAATPRPSPPPARSGAVSFRGDVAPLLLQKCGSCHVNDDKGDFAMRSFSELIDSGMVDAGDSQGSRLLEVIRTGDMPRGGGKVSPAELEMLAAWVDAGAKFDGPSPAANLRDLGGGNAMPVPPAAAGELQFSTHVAPILAANCTGCHGQNNPRAEFGLNTFARLMRGGESGAVVTPGNAASSLLVQKIKGTAAEGQRMPLGQAPLPAEQIAAIEKWINAGARFDGQDANQPLEQVAALGLARNSTHEELSQQRLAMAQANWRLAIPDEAAVELESANFLLMGNVPREQLQSLQAIAEQQAEKIESLLNLPPGKPLVKGRITLYAFRQRFDYTEFAMMVEKRRLPREVDGHWRYTIVDAYAALVPPEDDRDVSLQSLLAEQIAGVTLANATAAPGWFATGTARVIAARLDPEDPRIAAWQEQTPLAASRVRSADEFLKQQLPAEEQALLSYDLVQNMMKNAARYRSLMGELRQGAEFEAAVEKSYGAPLKTIVETWLRTASRS